MSTLSSLEAPPNLITPTLTINRDHGRMGLKNLGNTCYLNSTLQCLTHLPELITYITSPQFTSDLSHNKHNSSPSIFHTFAEKFQDLIITMWCNKPDHQDSPSLSYITPLELRKAFISIYPEFDNSNQQDAHEVLIFLLDALSTALNRTNDSSIKNSIPICNSNVYSKVNSTLNSVHKEINDSFIIDTFFGQMKSNIHCFNCGKVINENYDPFSSLELPIPNEYRLTIYFIPVKQRFRPFQIILAVNDNLRFKHLLPKVENVTSYKFTSGTFYWVFQNRLEKIVDIEERLGDLTNRTAFLFLMEMKCADNNNNNANDTDVIMNDQYNYNDNLRPKTYFYTELNINIIDNDNDNTIISDITYPRIFPYYPNNEQIDSNVIYISLFRELNEYLSQYVQKPEQVNISKEINYIVKSIIVNNTHICILCKKQSHEEFFCSCINPLLTNDTLNLETNNSLRSLIENLTDTFIFSVTANIKKSILKIKELNRCEDYTQHIRTEKEELSLYNLCDYFFAEERIVGNYTCDNCGVIKFLLKKQEMNSFPNVLILHLKRFSYNKDSRVNQLNVATKNDNPISFEEEIDLSKYNSKGLIGKYKLSSVIYHKGKISRGHYTAICKQFYLDKWFLFDDKNVTLFNANKCKMSPTQISKEEGYILFYRKN